MKKSSSSFRGEGPSLREWWHEFRETFRSLPDIRSKAEYIWDYYRLWIGGILGGVILVVFLIFHAIAAQKDTWIYCMFVNTNAEIGNGSDFQEAFEEYSGYDPDEKNIEFNNCSYFDYSKNVTGNSYYEAFVTYTEAGTLDVVTMSTDQLTALGESGRLLDLDSDECEEIREKYGDRFVYSTPNDEEYSTEPVAIGIDISDSSLAAEYKAYSGECALGIGAGSQRLDAVLTFLDFIFEEN